MVRAVAPAATCIPPAAIEDIYAPEHFGRTGFGTLEVAPASQ
jgi:uncharacterized protein YfaS (alpha-2-macroglobulin family)